MQVLPAIDLKEGRCVRLYKGDFDTAHQVADDPLAVARSYRAAGAELIHVVDLDGAREGRRRNADLVAALVRAAAPALVELGGGLRDMDALAEADALGVARFVVGSAAAEDPDFVRQAVARYGARLAVGLDAKDGVVQARGWLADTRLDYLDLARRMAALGVQTLIFTDIDTDGMLSGPNWARLEALRGAVSCDVVASGGVRSLEDVVALKRVGMAGVIIGKALYEGRIDLAACLKALADPPRKKATV
ncbi:MAG: 1-(5-phosphoribosyl)-5-[(5-phosphoribosylamino)methylideneamino]imidazole-4-carboxamide isomerase [Oscillospiraceae bacterium]|jgi:phosphoribosylformimino-5-aminoimidazole carboxamide ribotide isomerase|nr:1-(5-phosphoribosyl)-5-[(5-phosphoribosylamino)methylideneamino]imidazole-4-carboxamide isomerase [Oscillospiraceae bacterium]